jgi:hypothetical protein
MAKKKKKKIVYEPTGPQEHGGHKVGDKVMCFRYPDEKLSYGKITQIHLTDASGIPCFSFACEISGQYRLAMFDKIIVEPTDQQVKKKDRSRSMLYR